MVTDIRMTVEKYAPETCSNPPLTRPGPLNEKEQGLYDTVLAHFTAEGYQLPPPEGSKEDAPSDLTLDEKMWLVCLSLLSC